MSDKRFSGYFLVMEYAWLTLAISSLVTAGVIVRYHGINEECVKFGVLFLLSLAMYLYRRRKRKKETSKV